MKLLIWSDVKYDKYQSISFPGHYPYSPLNKPLLYNLEPYKKNCHVK
jgi:hypothetical protein